MGFADVPHVPASAPSGYTARARLAEEMQRGWWLLLLQGIAALAFGIITWTRPGIALATLVVFFGAYAIADGVLAIWSAFAERHHHDKWWLLLLEGALGLVIGALVLSNPGIAALTFVYYLAAWLVIRGVLEIVVGIKMRDAIRNEWRLILGGLLSIAVGVYLATRPAAGILAALWVIGFFAVVAGVLRILLALKVRSLRGKLAGS